MVNRLYLLFSAVALLFVIPFSAAVDVDLSDDTGSLGHISISGASNLYAYEVNFDYTGSYSSPQFDGFLGSSTSSGVSARNGVLSVYESKLDSTQTGVTGSGALFNISHSGDLELRYALFVYANGDQEYVYYNGSVSTGVISGGGGSGGQTSVPIISVVDTLLARDVELTADPDELTFDSIIGSNAFRTFNVTNEGNYSLTVTLHVDGLDGYLSVPEEITFAPYEQRIIVAELKPIDKGLLPGTISFIYRNESVLDVPVVLNVRSENFLFDTAISISDADRELSPGQQLLAQIDLKEVGQKEQIDVVATYFIKDYKGTTYLHESETFFVLNEKTYTKTFSTRNLPPGKYILGMELVYPGAFATSSLQFEIKDPFSFVKSPSTVFIGAASVVGVVVLLILFFTVLRRPTVRRHRR